MHWAGYTHICAKHSRDHQSPNLCPLDSGQPLPENAQNCMSAITSSSINSKKKKKYCPMHANLSKLNQIRSAFSFHQDLKQINGRITCKIDIHCPDVMILLDASIIMCQCSIWPKKIRSNLHYTSANPTCHNFSR